MSNYQKVLNLKNQIEQNWLSKEGVQGLSIGEEMDGNDYTGSFAIYIHVDSPRAIKTHRIPEAFEDVRVFIIEEDIPRKQADTAKYRPLLGGIQIAHSGGLGTLGCIAWDNAGGKAVALSNQHVMGDPGDNIGQPNLDSANIIGKTIRTVRSETVDAAISSIGDISYETKITQIGNVEGVYNVKPDDILGGGYPIEKRGRTTELTKGKITKIHYTGQKFKDLLYAVGDSGAFTMSGDSGSVYVNDDKKVVGLHWGGPGNYSYSLGFPIQNVMDQLNISILSTSEGRATKRKRKRMPS